MAGVGPTGPIATVPLPRRRQAGPCVTSADRGQIVTAPTDNRGRTGVTVDAAADARRRVTAVPARPRPAAASLLVVALPCLVTAAVVAVQISVPSYWRDEAATVAAVQRPLTALVYMLGNVDAVHGTYYLLMWPLARLFGTGQLIMRLPSLVAMSLAAGVVAATGRRLFSPSAGLLAGLLFAVLPNVSLYGQMARSYAMVTLAAAVASYLLVRLTENYTSRPGWIWYAASLAVLGALNIFGLLLIPAHAITMLARLRHEDRAVRRAAFARWLAAVCTAVVLNIPLLNLAYQQRVQISWVPAPNLESVGNALDLLGPPLMSVAILATILAGLWAARANRRLGSAKAQAAGLEPSGAGGSVAAAVSQPSFGPVAALTLPWLLLPAAVLLLASLDTPVYTSRYVMFCLPAGALLGGTALASLARAPRRRLAGWLAAAAALGVIATLGFGTQVQYRQPAGHADNIRAADMIIAANARPGDEVYYPWSVFMPISDAYPFGLGRLPDIQVGEPAIKSGTLAGTRVPRVELKQRLARAARVWVVNLSGDTNVARLLRPAGLHLVRTWKTSDIWLQLWVRDQPAGGHH